MSGYVKDKFESKYYQQATKHKTKVVNVNGVPCEVATRGGSVSTFPVKCIPDYKTELNKK